MRFHRFIRIPAVGLILGAVALLPLQSAPAFEVKPISAGQAAEYEGGMRLESILIHEFGHVIDGAGFDDSQTKRLQAAFDNAKAKGIYHEYWKDYWNGLHAKHPAEAVLRPSGQ